MVIFLTTKTLRKKAFLFSILTLILLTVMYVVVSGRYAIDQVQETASLGSRASLGTQMVNQLDESYFSNLLVGAMRSGFNEMGWYLNRSVFLYDDADSFKTDFDELVLYGTIDGNAIGNMPKKSFIVLLGNLTDTVYDLFGYKLTVDFNNESLLYYHSSAWNITALLQINYSLVGTGFSYINKTTYIESTIFIDGLLDPLVTAATEGAVVRTISRQQIPDDWTFEALANLSKSDEFMKYRQWPGAPSYLQRFTMNLSSDPNNFGIESFLNSSEVNYRLASLNPIFGTPIVCTHKPPSPPVCNHPDILISSFVDYSFFTNEPFCNEQIHRVNDIAEVMYNFTEESGLPSGFILDHFRVLNYTELVTAGEEYLSEDDRVDLRCPI